jgi:pimeloyl-[acyl-carrier protein] synthase
MSEVGSDPGQPEHALMDCLFGAEGRVDPAVAARQAPVPGCSHGFVTAALHDRRMVGSPIPPSEDLMFQVAARFLARLPPEQHRLLKGAFTGVFSPRRVEQYRSQITGTAKLLLDRFPRNGPVDLVAQFARPLPFTVICGVLGVPEGDQTWLADRMETFGRGVAGQRDRANVEAGNDATADMLAYFDDLLQNRAHAPADDLLTLLVNSGRMASMRDEMLANCIFFVLAGHATTTTLVAAGTHALAGRAELIQLTKDPSLWPAAIEELLRLISPTTLTGATATEDVEIDGVPVPAGARRALVFAAANRDPAVFTEPDALKLTRFPNPHLAFSAGAHFCLGAPLARLHGQVALDLLFRRHPDLKVVEGPIWLGSVPIRQVSAMTIDWPR